MYDTIIDKATERLAEVAPSMRLRWTQVGIGLRIESEYGDHVWEMILSPELLFNQRNAIDAIVARNRLLIERVHNIGKERKPTALDLLLDKWHERISNDT